MWDGHAGCDPRKFVKLLFDLCFTVTVFFLTRSSFFHAAGEPFAVSFNTLHRPDSA